MNKIIKAINDYQMLQGDEAVVVGLSGGADSIALTHFLKFQLHLSVIACHVNHNLRDGENLRDRDFVLATCKSWNIPCYLYELDIAALAHSQGISAEEAGRNARYDCFQELATRFHAKIATAHTLSDSVETVLFNLTRGTALKGLCGIPPVRGRIIRPLITTTRDEVEQYCAQEGLSFVTDSTNLLPDYSRNKLRLCVIPLLKELNPSLEQTIDNTLSVLTAEQTYLDSQARQAYTDCFFEQTLKTERLCQYDPAIQRRVLALFLEQLSISVCFDLINRIQTALHTIPIKTEKWEVSSKRYLLLSKDCLQAEDSAPLCPYFRSALEIPSVFESKSGKTYQIRLLSQTDTNLFKKVHRNLSSLFLDYDKIVGTVFMRQREIGDCIQLENRPNKTLKKLFIEQKLTNAEKSRRFVLTDEQHLLAVEGFGCALHVQVTDSTHTILSILEVTPQASQIVLSK